MTRTYVKSVDVGEFPQARRGFQVTRCNQCTDAPCVTACPTGAILVGDASDPASPVAQIVGREPVQVRRPEKGTRPAVYYKGAHQAALDPLAARRPDGGLFAWATQGAPDAQLVASGSPAGTTSSAAALLSYDVPHHAPWGCSGGFWG